MIFKRFDPEPETTPPDTCSVCRNLTFSGYIHQDTIEVVCDVCFLELFREAVKAAAS